MIAVANCVCGPTSFETWIRGSFSGALATLDGVAGIQAFSLRRLVGASAQQCVFVSVTLWDGLSCFETWRTSAAFVSAHPDRTRFRTEFSRMLSIRFDFAAGPKAGIADFDSRILARLSTGYPLLGSVGGVLVEELRWEPGRQRTERGADAEVTRL